MTRGHAPAPADQATVGGGRDGTPRYGWAIVAALAATQTVGYGVLYYAYAVFLHPMVTALHDPGYWVLTVAFLASAAAVAVIAVHLVAYLTELGHTPGFAASVAGLLGILSVTGRLATTATTRRPSAGTATAIVSPSKAPP